MTSVFASSFIGTLGWALLHFLWQGALVALLAGLALRVLHAARPQLRYIVALAGLAMCVGLPLVQLIATLPSSTVHIVAEQAGQAIVSFSGEAGVRGWIDANMGALVAVWLGCVVLLSLRLVGGLLWIEGLARTAGASSASWQQRVDALAARMQLACRVPLLVTESLDSPVAVGILRPVVLVPAALVSGMPVALLEALIAHELAHVQRHDYLVNLLQGAAEVLLFYHPAVWWLSRRVRIERELVADDMAAQALGNARSLALALQALDSFQQGVSTARYAPAARGGNLLARIQRLLLPHVRPSGWPAGLILPAVALACAVLAAPAGSAPAVLPDTVPPLSATAQGPEAPVAQLPPAAAASTTVVPVKKPKTARSAEAAAATPSTAPAAAPASPTIPDSGMPGREAFEVKPPVMAKNGCDESLRPVPSAYPSATRRPIGINLLVGPDGRVNSATLARGSGVAGLDEATRRYAGSCRYEPGTMGGQPAEVHVLTWFVWNTLAEKPVDPTRTNAVVNSLQCRKPVYPPQALAQERTGSVVMEFLVDVGGKVRDGRIIKSSGHGDLDEAAYEALKLCSFTPGTHNGQPEESWTRMMYVWKLE